MSLTKEQELYFNEFKLSDDFRYNYEQIINLIQNNFIEQQNNIIIIDKKTTNSNYLFNPYKSKNNSFVIQYNGYNKSISFCLLRFLNDYKSYYKFMNLLYDN